MPRAIFSGGPYGLYFHDNLWVFECFHSLLKLFLHLDECKVKPKPLNPGQTVFYMVQPRFMNVDIRIVVDVTQGALDLFLSPRDDTFVVNMNSSNGFHEVKWNSNIRSLVHGFNEYKYVWGVYLSHLRFNKVTGFRRSSKRVREENQNSKWYICVFFINWSTTYKICTDKWNFRTVIHLWNNLKNCLLLLCNCDKSS